MTPATQQQIIQAERHFRSGQAALAEPLLRRIIESEPRVAKAHELLAYVCGNRGDLAACEESLLKAAALPGCSAEAFFYLGRIHLQHARAREALAAFDRSLQLGGEYFEALHERGVAQGALGEHAQALASFQRAERINPRSLELQSNLADTLAALHHFAAALRHYDRALTLDPKRVRSWSDRGAALTELGRGAEALASYERALALAPEDVPTWMNRATTLMLLKRHVDALACYDEVARLAPQTDYLRGHRLHAAMLVGRWQDWSLQVEDTLARVDEGEKAATPFSVMATPASPATLLTCARNYARDHYPPREAVARVQPRKARKVRVGYFSTDFRNHPVAQLTARLFECHDRTRFEFSGFSLGLPATDEMSQRIAASLHPFTEVGAKSDEEIAAMARSAGIDIAVDLNGLTEGSRPGIFACRAAPVQVNFLGFPGSMGCDYIDYIVADSTLIRPEDYPHYAEKVVVMPGAYQPNDDSKRIADAATTRESMGLPADGFVFACFNNQYKITPDLFDVWMRLLRQVPGSVLWLLASNADAQAALAAEAQARGVAPERIVFAERMPLAEHLARHAHADLFLDSFHYNAHTTASDALWAGLPVLTMAGATFASRVCASLLGAVGLPELVTRTVADYEALALSLATSPRRLAELRSRLHAHRTTMPLFDTPLFARRLEAAFDAMWLRHAQGLAPDHIELHDEMPSPAGS